MRTVAALLIFFLLAATECAAACVVKLCPAGSRTDVSAAQAGETSVPPCHQKQQPPGKQNHSPDSGSKCKLEFAATEVDAAVAAGVAQAMESFSAAESGGFSRHALIHRPVHFSTWQSLPPGAAGAGASVPLRI